MTSTNFTIDNVNPLIQYTPAAAWSEGSKTGDPLSSSYSNGGTFTLSTTQGSSATFSFTGTQVFVFGAKRSNHGPYSITLDGTSTLFDGAADPPIFGTLFASDVLPQAQHTITVTNELSDTAKPFLDIDFITWTTTGADNGQPKQVEDTDASFAFQPPAAWSTNVAGAQLTGFSGGNGHATNSVGATSTITFSGNFITIFGPVGPTISRYAVQMDGKAVGTFNGTKEAYTPQVALYHADGLGAGTHSVSLIAQPAVVGQILAIDFVQVSAEKPAGAATSSAVGAGVGAGAGAANGASSTKNASGTKSAAGSKASKTGTSEGATASGQAKASSSIGPAVGGAVAGILVIAALIFLLFFLRKRRRRQQQPMLTEPKYPGPSGYNTMGNSNTVTTNVPASEMGAYGAPSTTYSAPTQGGYANQGGYGYGAQQNSQTQLVQSAPYQESVTGGGGGYGYGYAQSQARGPPSQYHGSAAARPPSQVYSDPSTDADPYGGMEDPYGGMASPPASQAPHQPNPWGSSHSGQSNTSRSFYAVNNDDDGPSALGRSATTNSSGAAGLGAGGNNLRQSKGGPLPLPPTANVPLPPGASRMHVVGREQDFGPLPPDYTQATEPYRS